MGTASLVLGIISMVIGTLAGGGFNWVGVIVGIIGIVLGIEGKKETGTGRHGTGRLYLFYCRSCALPSHIYCLRGLRGMPWH